MAVTEQGNHPVASGSDSSLDSGDERPPAQMGTVRAGAGGDKGLITRPALGIGAGQDQDKGDGLSDESRGMSHVRLDSKASLNSLGKRRMMEEEPAVVQVKDCEGPDAVEEIVLDQYDSPTKDGQYLFPTLPSPTFDILQPRPHPLHPDYLGVNSALTVSTSLSASRPVASTINSLSSSQRPILSHYTSNESNASAVGIGTGQNSKPSWKHKSGRTKRTPDQRRLAALGFEEELERDFDFWASWGIGMCNIGFLPGTFLGCLTALEVGGPSMYSIAWPITGIFMTCLAAVMGEMASTYPVAGAMFTWTFRVCRSSKRFNPWARYISWVNGSFLLCSHILTQIVITYQLSHLIQGVAMLHSPSFETTFWKGMGICWAVLAVCGIVVSSRASRSPWLWRSCGAFTVIGFLTMNIVFLTQAKEIRSAKFVFTTYGNATGLSSKAYVYLIGWCLTCVASGMEACAHMAEDTKRPSRTVPLAMFWSVASTYLMGWITICILMATANYNELDARLQPSVALIRNTLSLRYSTLLLVIVILGLIAQNIAQLLATSRFIWALARESALPFSDLFKRISKGSKQPLPAIWVVVGIAAPALLLLGISISIVGTILLEGAGWSVVFAYLMPVAIYLSAGKEALSGDGRAKWSLRGFSIPLSWFSTFFALVFLIVLCLPTGAPLNSLTASYASGIAVGVLFFSSLAWICYGNARYAGPIKTTTRWTIGAEVELPASTTFKITIPALADQASTADHGRTAHVFSSFPTLRSNDVPVSSSGEWTTNSEWTSDYDSQMEESRVSPMDSLEEEAEYRSRRTRDESVDGRQEDLRRGARPPPV